MMTWPSMVSRGPPSSAGVMKKPSEPMKTSRPAAATPGIDSWKNTRQNACTPLAPSVCAASGRRASIWLITGSMVTTASGSMVCVMAKITVPRLNSRSGGSAMPTQRAKLATMPVRPSRTSQAKFLTNALVQNGSSTSSMTMRWRCFGSRTSQ